MFLESGERSECYGCKACLSACHTGAIRFKIVEDTYPYPTIDEAKCVNCGACRRVCPTGYTNFIVPEVCLAAVAKSHDDWEKSSSGGAFKALALVVKEYCDKRGQEFYICGCSWEKKLKACHKLKKVMVESDIDVFSKSKYVQSDMREVYIEIKKTLVDEKNYVMFVGTPCQVAALQMFTSGMGGGGGRENRLLTIDLVCNGAPGQVIFDKYIEDLESTHNSEVEEYNFKNKKMMGNGTIYNRSSRIVFRDGEERRVNRFNDDYVKLYYTAGYHFRPSCYPCRFKRPERTGDITIGDAWNIDKIYPELNPLQGVSLILFNTAEGKELLTSIEKRMKIYTLNYEYAVLNNKPLREVSNNNVPQYIVDEFFAGISDESKTFHECAERFCDEINEVKSNK